METTISYGGVTDSQICWLMTNPLWIQMITQHAKVWQPAYEWVTIHQGNETNLLCESTGIRRNGLFTIRVSTVRVLWIPHELFFTLRVWK